MLRVVITTLGHVFRSVWTWVGFLTGGAGLWSEIVGPIGDIPTWVFAVAAFLALFAALVQRQATLDSYSKPKRNRTLKQAVNYVVTGTWNIEGQGDQRPFKKAEPTLQRIREYALEGRLKIWARKTPHSVPDPIPDAYWEWWQFDLITFLSEENKRAVERRLGQPPANLDFVCYEPELNADELRREFSGAFWRHLSMRFRNCVRSLRDSLLKI